MYRKKKKNSQRPDPMSIESNDCPALKRVCLKLCRAYREANFTICNRNHILHSCADCYILFCEPRNSSIQNILSFEASNSTPAFYHDNQRPTCVDFDRRGTCARPKQVRIGRAIRTSLRSTHDTLPGSAHSRRVNTATNRCESSALPQMGGAPRLVPADQTWIFCLADVSEETPGGASEGDMFTM